MLSDFYDIVYRPGSTTFSVVNDATDGYGIVTYSMLTGERCSSVFLRHPESVRLGHDNLADVDVLFNPEPVSVGQDRCTTQFLLMGDGTVSVGSSLWNTHVLRTSTGQEVRVSTEICSAAEAPSLVGMRATCTGNVLGLHRRNFGFLLFHRVNQLRKAWIEANVKLAEKYGY